MGAGSATATPGPPRAIFAYEFGSFRGLCSACICSYWAYASAYATPEGTQIQEVAAEGDSGPQLTGPSQRLLCPTAACLAFMPAPSAAQAAPPERARRWSRRVVHVPARIRILSKSPQKQLRRLIRMFWRLFPCHQPRRSLPGIC